MNVFFFCSFFVLYYHRVLRGSSQNSSSARCSNILIIKAKEHKTEEGKTKQNTDRCVVRTAVHTKELQIISSYILYTYSHPENLHKILSIVNKLLKETPAARARCTFILSPSIMALFFALLLRSATRQGFFFAKLIDSPSSRAVDFVIDALYILI